MTSNPRSVVVDTTKSPHARLKPVPVSAVTLTDAFWAPRLRINREVTLPTQYRLLEETGRLDNFRVAAGKDPAEYGRTDIDRFVHRGAYYEKYGQSLGVEGTEWNRQPTLQGPRLTGACFYLAVAYRCARPWKSVAPTAHCHPVWNPG
jgi:hypothetical protein